MNGPRTGIKASELIKKLQAMIAQHGDRECTTGGTDYPEGVAGVTMEKTGNGYTPKGNFVIY